MAALIGALSSGLPSHHHEGSEPGPRLVDAGHHGHGVQLTEQTDRLKSELVAPGLPAPRVLLAQDDAPVIEAVAAPAIEPAPLGRPPPSDRPRAPPVSA
jgi:hypothetical protein